MVTTLCIVSGNNRLVVEISQGRASGVFRNTSANTTLNFDQFPFAQLHQLCPGLFACGCKKEGQ